MGGGHEGNWRRKGRAKRERKGRHDGTGSEIPQPLLCLVRARFLPRPALQAAEEAAKAAKAKEEELRTGNPLLGAVAGQDVTFNIKRRWGNRRAAQQLKRKRSACGGEAGRGAGLGGSVAQQLVAGQTAEACLDVGRGSIDGSAGCKLHMMRVECVPLRCGREGGQVGGRPAAWRVMSWRGRGQGQGRYAGDARDKCRR